MKIIFIAGPFRGDGSIEAKRQNIAQAQKFVQLFIENSINYYSAHLNIDQEIIDTFDEKNSNFALKLNTEILRRSDALAVLPGWETSNGTKREIADAEKLGFPVFYLTDENSISEIVKWLGENN